MIIIAYGYKDVQFTAPSYNTLDGLRNDIVSKQQDDNVIVQNS